jgi:hypothetical protein
MIGALLLLATAGSTIDDGWPPRGRYRRDATAQVHFVDQKHVTGYCDAGDPDAPGDVTIACQSGFTLYLPNPCAYRGEYARIACHELGHINGWPNNHPGSRSRK